MTQTHSEKEVRKTALKKLRGERKEKIAAASVVVKTQKKAIEAIKEMLKDGGRTVPQVAEGTDMTPSEVFWYMMALKKYGEIVEGEKDGSYFRYMLASGTGEETDESL